MQTPLLRSVGASGSKVTWALRKCLAASPLKWCLIAAGLYVLSVFFLLVNAPTREFVIAQQSIRSYGEHAYVVALSGARSPYVIQSDDMDSAHRSRLSIYEDGIQMGPPHAIHATIRTVGNGSFSHWSGSLIFSTSDNTDPRINGRTYSVKIPLGLNPVLLLSVLPLGTLMLLWVIGYLSRFAEHFGPTAADRRDHANELHQTSPHWLIGHLAPLGLAALPSLALFAVLPPLYTDITITAAVTNPAMMMPHYPPLYAYFLWVTHYAANTVCHVPAGVSECGLYAMVAAQHLLLINAVYYFAIGCSENVLGRMAAIFPFYVMPAFLLVNHGLQTEALWFSCLIFMLGTTVRVLRTEQISPRTLLILFSSFTAALLIRPTTLFLVPVVPLALSLAMLRKRRQAALRKLILVAVVLLIGLAWGQIATYTAFAAHGIEYRSVWGRGTIEIVQRVLWRLEAGRDDPSPVLRTELIKDLQAQADDPLLRHAIPTIVTYLDADYTGNDKSTVWGGAHYALMRLGTRDASDTPVTVDFATADRLVNRFCLLFIRTYPALIADYATTNAIGYFKDALGWTNESGLHATLWAKIAALRSVANGIGDIPGIRNLPMVQQNAELLALYQHFSESVIIHVLGDISDIEWVGILFFLVLIGLLGRRLSPSLFLFVLAGSLTAVMYIGVSSMLLAHLPRYEVPYELLISAMLAVAMAAVVTPHGLRRTDQSSFAMGFGLIRAALCSGALVVPIILFTAWIFRPTLNAVLAADVMRSVGGYAYSAPISFPVRFLYVNASDDESEPSRSALVLSENGRALGPAHAEHNAIRRMGGGSFSDWKSELVFSSSDGTDPRTNRRSYIIEAKAQLRPSLISCSIVLFLVCTVGLYFFEKRRPLNKVRVSLFHAAMLNAAMLITAVEALDLYRISHLYPLLGWDSISFLSGSSARGPVYTTLLHASIWLDPSGRLLVPIQLCFLFLSFACLGWSVGRLVRNGLVGWLTVFLLLADTGVTRFALTMLSEPVFTALVVLHFAAVLTFFRRPSTAAAVFVGFSCGLAILVRPAGYSLLLTIAFLIVVADRDRLRVVLQTAVPAFVLLIFGVSANFALSGGFGTHTIGGVSLLGHVLHLAKPDAKTPYPGLYSELAAIAAAHSTSGKADYPVAYWQVTGSEYNKLLWELSVPRIIAFVKNEARSHGDDESFRNDDIVENNLLLSRVDQISFELAVAIIRSQPVGYLRHVLAHLYGMWANLFKNYGSVSAAASLQANDWPSIAKRRQIEEYVSRTSYPAERIRTWLAENSPPTPSDRLWSAIEPVLRALVLAAPFLTLGAIGVWLFRIAQGRPSCPALNALAFCSLQVWGYFGLVATVQAALDRYSVVFEPIMIILFLLSGMLMVAAVRNRMPRGWRNAMTLTGESHVSSEILDPEKASAGTHLR